MLRVQLDYGRLGVAAIVAAKLFETRHRKTDLPHATRRASGSRGPCRHLLKGLPMGEVLRRLGGHCRNHMNLERFHLRSPNHRQGWQEDHLFCAIVAVGGLPLK